MNDHIHSETNKSFGAFLRSRVRRGIPSTQADAWNTVKRTWWPIVIGLLLLTMPGSPMRIAARVLVTAILVERVVNLKYQMPLLDTWAIRSLELATLCISIGLFLADRRPILLLFVPGVIVLMLVYVNYNYERWKLKFTT